MSLPTFFSDIHCVPGIGVWVSDVRLFQLLGQFLVGHEQIELSYTLGSGYRGRAFVLLKLVQ